MSIRLWAMFFKSLSVLTAFLYFANGTTSHKHLIQKIMGGHAVSIVDFPYQVSLRLQMKHICGGSLINPTHVLTAAHCLIRLERSIGSLGVTMGHSSLRTAYPIYTVRHFVLHPDYIHGSFPIINDIAIIKLYSPVKLDGVTVAIIPMATKTPPADTICIVSGWGTVEEAPLGESTKIQTNLRAVTLPLVDRDECRSVSGVNESVICAGIPIGGKDACQGDSGGPLACEGRLAGIVSWGPGCGRAHLPGVYTDVSYFAKWIQDNSPASSGPLPLTFLVLILSSLLITLI